MQKKFVFDDEFDELLDDELVEELSEQNSCPRDQDNYLLERNFYLSYNIDERTWKSNVEDIKGGDNFADYCEYIFKVLEDEGDFDN